jgi:hypothetical protein
MISALWLKGHTCSLQPKEARVRYPTIVWLVVGFLQLIAAPVPAQIDGGYSAPRELMELFSP